MIRITQYNSSSRKGCTSAIILAHPQQFYPTPPTPSQQFHDPRASSGYKDLRAQTPPRSPLPPDHAGPADAATHRWSNLMNYYYQPFSEQSQQTSDSYYRLASEDYDIKIRQQPRDALLAQDGKEKGESSATCTDGRAVIDFADMHMQRASP